MQRIISLFQRHGAQADFTARLAPHLEHLYRLAYRFTGRREDAEDLVQELLAKLWPKRAELAEVVSPRGFLSRTLYHLFVDHYRRRNADELVTDMQAWEQSDDSAAHERLEAAPGRLHLEGLELALSELPPELRALLILHDVEGYTLAELATLLDAPEGTLKSRLHRTRRRLRDRLTTYDKTYSSETPNRRTWRIPKQPEDAAFSETRSPHIQGVESKD